VALILDGNRRFARLCHYPDIIDGHRAGAQKVIDVIGWCDELSIPVVTLWGLSTENLKRERREVDHICQVIGERLEAFTKGETPYPLRRRIRAIGRLELLPEWLQHSIREAEQKSASSGPWLLNVAVAYGGRDELLDAFRMLLRVRGSQGDDPLKIAQELTPQDIQRYLYAPEIPEPDLVIRTSGEVRLSGFFLWQTAFSELYFCDTLWPAFRKIDFLRAIRTFQCRQRRFGL
jgi:short-chain Z-isoprenyl diphosphate synthase